MDELRYDTALRQHLNKRTEMANYAMFADLNVGMGVVSVGMPSACFAPNSSRSDCRQGPRQLRFSGSFTSPY